MITGVRLIIIGRQGAGKGTQCLRMSRHYVVPHISTGDMLRAAVREGTELGRLAEQVIQAGRLVGDEIMIGLVAERLQQDDARNRGYILDGFPRTVAQAEALDRISVDRPIDAVIDIDVPRDMVIARISSRRTCRDCGTNYTSKGASTARGSAIRAGETWCSVPTTPPTPSINVWISTRARPVPCSTTTDGRVV